MIVYERINISDRCFWKYVRIVIQDRFSCSVLLSNLSDRVTLARDANKYPDQTKDIIFDITLI